MWYVLHSVTLTKDEYQLPTYLHQWQTQDKSLAMTSDSNNILAMNCALTIVYVEDVHTGDTPF